MRRLALALLLLAAPLYGQARHPPTIAASQLPTCDDTRDGSFLSIVDATAVDDCTATGGGSITASCKCEQNPGGVFAWVVVGADDQVAAEVPFTPAGGIAATDVQAALEEVDAEHTVDTDTTCLDAGVVCLFAASSTEGGAATSTTEAAVTAHQAALTITEAQISDLAHTVDTDDQTAVEVPYTPTTGTDWVDPDPASVLAGLDDLAGRLTTEEAKADDDVPEAGDFGALALTGDVTSVGLTTTVVSGAVGITELGDDATCSGLDVVRRNAGDTAFECSAPSAAAAWETLINSANTATSYTSDSDAETVTLDFQSNYSTDRVVIQQTVGNATAGALLKVNTQDAQSPSLVLDGPGATDDITFHGGTSSTAISIDKTGAGAGAIEFLQTGTREAQIQFDGTETLRVMTLNTGDDITFRPGNEEVLRLGNNGTSSLVTITGDTTQTGNVLAIDGNGDAAVDITVGPDGTVSMGLDDTTAQLKLPLSNDATTPTLAFGDGDSGCYEAIDDMIRCSSAGTQAFQFQGAVMSATSSAGSTKWALINQNASATVPVFTFEGDQDTGIGKNTNDELSLIAGGVEMVRLVEGTSDYIKFDTEATAPATCAIGDFYVDTSGAYCACTSTNTWENLSATGSCA